MSDFDVSEEKLSAYFDGELTQQESQKIEVLLRRSPERREKFEDMRRLRDQVRELDFPQPTEAEWRNVMSGATVKATRGLGWLLWIGAAVALVGYGLWEFASDPGVAALERVGVLAMLTGVVLVFLSVLFERIRAHRSDKYKDLEK